MARAGRRDNRSTEAAEYRRWYKSTEWRSLRIVQLAHHPLCQRCSTPTRPVPAGVVNHKTPHKGDQILFFDAANLESVCKPCHDGLIQREEKRGHRIGCDERGWPIDPDHHWNR